MSFLSVLKKRVKHIPAFAWPISGFLGIILFGLLIILSDSKNERLKGSLIISVGAVGLAWRLRLLLQIWKARQTKLRAIDERRAMLQLRRVRKHRDRVEKEAEKTTAVQEASRVKKLHEAEASIQREFILKDQLRRQEKERLIASEVEKILQLTGSPLLHMVKSILEGCGNRIISAAIEGEMLLARPEDDKLIVAIVILDDREADVEDMKRLEIFRKHENASLSYLISIYGFNEQSVLMTTNCTVMLIDVYLLTEWKLSPSGSSNEPKS